MQRGNLEEFWGLGAKREFAEEFLSRLFGALEHLTKGLQVGLHFGAALRRVRITGKGPTDLFDDGAAFVASDSRGHGQDYR
jgi:hypothetical protein